MQDLLKKLKLTATFTTELPVSKEDFIATLRKYVDKGDTGYFFAYIGNIFSSSDKEYKGHIDRQGFKIARKARFLDTSQSHLAVARGTYREHRGILEVSVHVSGFRKVFVVFYVLVGLFYVFFLGMFLRGGAEEGLYIVVPFILVHAAFMFAIPYFLMRRSTKHLARELERDFHYFVHRRS